MSPSGFPGGPTEFDGSGSRSRAVRSGRTYAGRFRTLCRPGLQSCHRLRFLGGWGGALPAASDASTSLIIEGNGRHGVRPLRRWHKSSASSKGESAIYLDQSETPPPLGGTHIHRRFERLTLQAPASAGGV